MNSRPATTLPPVEIESPRRRLLIGGLGILQAVSILGEVLAASRFPVPYDWVRRTISDLGASPAWFTAGQGGALPTMSGAIPGIFNNLLFLSGIALVLLVVCAQRRPGFRGAAGVLWILAGLSTALTAEFPLGRSTDLHVLVSTPAFLAGPLAMLIGALQRRGVARVLGAPVGAVCVLTGAFFLISADAQTAAGGLFERVTLWPPILWALVLAIIPPRPRADREGAC